MGWLDGWDIALILIATYIAVMALVRMMARRRDQLVADVRRQIDARRQTKPKPGRSGKGRDAA
jgi:hypothetical protein